MSIHDTTTLSVQFNFELQFQIIQRNAKFQSSKPGKFELVNIRLDLLEFLDNDILVVGSVVFFSARYWVTR